MLNRKNNIILLVLLFVANISVFAQDNTDAQQQNNNVDQNPIAPANPPANTGNLPIVENDPEADSVGLPRVADEKLTTVLIDNFEIPQGWLANIPLDFGISKILYRDGSPQELAGDTNKMVLGVKTVFFKRNYGWMSIDRPYPLSLKNFVRSFGIWISGRNKRHVFSIKVRDVVYNRMRLSAGEMRFQGWKKFLVPVSDSVIQFEPARNTIGLEFLGFHIDFLADDTSKLEPYYLYLDQFTATMNMAANKADDDISDDW